MPRVIYTTPGIKRLKFYYADGKQGVIENGYVLLTEQEDIDRMDAAIAGMARGSRGMLRRIDEDEESEAVQAAVEQAKKENDKTTAAIIGATTTQNTGFAPNPQHAQEMAELHKTTEQSVQNIFKQVEMEK